MIESHDRMKWALASISQAAQSEGKLCNFPNNTFREYVNDFMHCMHSTSLFLRPKDSVCWGWWRWADEMRVTSWNFLVQTPNYFLRTSFAETWQPHPSDFHGKNPYTFPMFSGCHPTKTCQERGPLEGAWKFRRSLGPEHVRPRHAQPGRDGTGFPFNGKRG